MRKSGLSSTVHAELLSLVDKLKGRRIVVIGDVMLDVYIRGTVGRISPEAPIPVVEVNHPDFKLPGGAANVASNVTALGGRAIVVGVIGRDRCGRELTVELKKRGVDTRGLISLEDRPTTEKTRVIAGSQQLVRIDREVSSTLTPEQQKRVVHAALEAVRDADGVIFEDYNKGVLAPNVIRQVLAFARSQKKIIAADPKFNNFFSFKGVTVVKPNMKEVMAALGSVNGTAGFESAGSKVLTQLKCKSVLLTRSEHGMTLFETGRRARTIPALAREVFDVSGAGDTVIATLTLALTAGAPLFHAAALANYAAGIEVEKLGVATVSSEELRERLLEETKRL